MPSVLLVPDLPLERWAAMEKYAHRLHDWFESSDFGFQVRLAAHIGALTRDSVGRRGATAEQRSSDRRKAFVSWWSQPVDPSRLDGAPVLSPAMSLRDALAEMLASEKQVGMVRDGDRYLGVLTLSHIGKILRTEDRT